MANSILLEDGFTLTDLLSQNGVTLEFGKDITEEEEEEEEERDIGYSKNVFMSNDEILKFLNMGDIDDDEDEKNVVNEETPEAVMPCDISFDKLRKKMSDILGNGMVMKLIRREGVGETVPENAEVAIKYIGYFEYHDEPFDSSYAHGSEPDRFRLGQGALLPGLEIGVSTMKKHEVSLFLIKPEYAYGRLGCLPRIPPNQEVLFTVYLTDFMDNGFLDSFQDLSLEDRKSFSLIKKHILNIMTTANENFKREKLRQAIREYTKAADLLEGASLENDEEEKEQKKLLTRAYGNLAVCYNKENLPRKVCIVCQKVPYPNAKSYFNYGRALLRLGEFKQAKNYLWKAKELEPRDKKIYDEMKLADDMHVKYNAAEKRLWSNCLRITKEEAAKTEFEKAAHELCKTFKNDIDLVRQPIPDGLTPDEDKCIREIAISYGLSITNHKRYGKEIVFLSKPNY